MLNSVILVGRLVETPTLKTYNDSVYTIVTLAVNRSFRSLSGEIETDFIKCIAWEAIGKSACDYCRKGDIIAVRGRLQVKTKDMTITAESGEVIKKKITSLEVLAERVIFINTTGQKENQELDVEEYDE